MTQGLYSGMYFHHFVETLLRSSQSCHDPRDPAAIIVIHDFLRSIAIFFWMDLVIPDCKKIAK